MPGGRSPPRGAAVGRRFHLVKSLLPSIDATVEDRPMATPVREGDLLWTPSAARVADANLTAFTSWLAAGRGLRFDDYHALWRWSVADLEGFWQAVWDYSGIDVSAPPERVLGRRAMPGAEWFPGARLN